MEYYVFKRSGSFRASMPTKNQCKSVGHNPYRYELKMIFPNSIKLNHKAQICDHFDIDDMIQRLKIFGSCEEMHKIICEGYKKFFKSRGLNLLACRTSIIPVKDPMANIDYVFISPKASTKAQLMLLI